MPHLILEYSANIAPALAAANVTAIGHAVMLESGLFTPKAVKSRSHIATDFCVGEAGEGAFFHALVYLMEGRSLEQKQVLAKAMMQAFAPLVPDGASLTIDVRELDPAIYQKRG